jgi:cell division transport system permease protein
MLKNKHKKNTKLSVYDLSENIFTEFGRGIKLGLVNLWRNKLLTLATVFVMAVMICIFNSILAVNFITREALTNLNQKVDLIYYLKEGTDYNTASLIMSEIKTLPGIKKISYISKDQALQIVAKTYPETASFFDKFNLKNPLPASLSITTENAESHSEINRLLMQSKYRNYLEQNLQNNQQNDQKILASTTENLININNFVKQLIFWIVFTFIIGGALITINAIQLTIFTRRKEIFIMRLVGATPNFIRLPFITEGILYAIFAVIFSFILLFIASLLVGNQNLQFLGELNNLNLFNIFLSELILTTLISLISSLITVEQYLKGNLSYSQ